MALNKVLNCGEVETFHMNKVWLDIISTSVLIKQKDFNIIRLSEVIKGASWMSCLVSS